MDLHMPSLDTIVPEDLAVYFMQQVVKFTKACYITVFQTILRGGGEFPTSVRQGGFLTGNR